MVQTWYTEALNVFPERQYTLDLADDAQYSSFGLRLQLKRWVEGTKRCADGELCPQSECVDHLPLSPTIISLHFANPP